MFDFIKELKPYCNSLIFSRSSDAVYVIQPAGLIITSEVDNLCPKLSIDPRGRVRDRRIHRQRRIMEPLDEGNYDTHNCSSDRPIALLYPQYSIEEIN